MASHGKDLTPNHIVELLELINERLAQKGINGHLIIGGGAVMSLCHNARASTRDIDALFEPRREFRDVVAEIAAERNLEQDWLNDAFKGFINPGGMTTEALFSFSNLEVSRLDDETMLALKLTSARTATDRDAVDALALLEAMHPSSIDEIYDIVESRAYPSLLTPKVDYFIQEVFETYQKRFADDKNETPAELMERARQAAASASQDRRCPSTKHR